MRMRPAAHLAEDGRCRNVHGAPAFGTGSKVVLTVAHLDHVPEHNERSNLMVACQGCHLHYDREHHAQTRASRLERAGQLRLDPDEVKFGPGVAIPVQSTHAHLTGITDSSARDDELYAQQLRDDFYRHIGIGAEIAREKGYVFEPDPQAAEEARIAALIDRWPPPTIDQLRELYVTDEIDIETFEAAVAQALKRERT